MGIVHRVIIAEDHRIVRDGLRAILAAEPDLEVVGEAADGLEAIRCAAELKPDVVILDLSMPRMNGMEALAEIKRTGETTRVVVLTVHREEEYVFAALRAGADGYVLKDSAAAELLLAVRSVAAGDRYLSPPVATTVVADFLGSNRSSPASSLFGELSSREREILKLVAEGYRTRQIGEYLNISAKTVEKHRSNLMRKLGLNSVSALTAYAIEKGIVSR